MKLRYKKWFWFVTVIAIISGTVFQISQTQAAQPPPPERWILLVEDTVSSDSFKVSYKAESSGDSPPGWTGPVTWTPQVNDLSSSEKQNALKMLPRGFSFGIFLIESPNSEQRIITKLSDTTDGDTFQNLKKGGGYLFGGYEPIPATTPPPTTSIIIIIAIAAGIGYLLYAKTRAQK